MIAGVAGMRVLAARGGEFGERYIVRSSVGCSSRCSRRCLRICVRLLSGPAALIEPLFEDLATGRFAGRAGRGSARLRCCCSLYWLAANVAFHRPTLVAIDDLHWADTPSLRWLLYPAKVGGASAGRRGDAAAGGRGRDPALVAELIADPEATAIRPEPLGRGSIAVLAREVHGLEPDEVFCAALETATGGNPLFPGFSTVGDFSRFFPPRNPVAPRCPSFSGLEGQPFSRAMAASRTPTAEEASARRAKLRACHQPHFAVARRLSSSRWTCR